MTIEEMRTLHRRAIVEAESKRTELRLVLASRYRELVGSSDEVIHMRERAEELAGLVEALPGLIERLAVCADGGGGVEVGIGVGVGLQGGIGAVAGEEKKEQQEDDNDDEDEDEGEGGHSGEKLAILEAEGTHVHAETKEGDEGDDMNADAADAAHRWVVRARLELLRLPREAHRRLDGGDAHGAASLILTLFDLLAAVTTTTTATNTAGKDEGEIQSPFPLAAALAGRLVSASSSSTSLTLTLRPSSSLALTSMSMPSPPRWQSHPQSSLLRIQMKMTYLHVQTLPARTVRLARRVLLRAAGGGGAYSAAAALSALDLLDVDRDDASRAARLVDLYYDSKARLLNRLLDKLGSNAADVMDTTDATERVLSKIVSILQHDVILHPYQIFVLRKFGEQSLLDSTCATVMATLPLKFDSDLVRSKASRFLAAHLPLIRTKVGAVLRIIAGTTASKLGRMRQVLYDETDGAERMAKLDEEANEGGCSWDEAVAGTVDVRVVSHGTAFSKQKQLELDAPAAAATATSTSSSTSNSPRRFSLWSALFSNAFSSLVHGLLTASFHSVHARVGSALRASLARAPPPSAMLPHEARRNALRIAVDLDASLRRVSDDAHELLVHAEEREESERRLRQSLYVQTCEIMGRLLNELRRMLSTSSSDGNGHDATKELVVGRLCHLLKFRLRSLPALLDPKSSPAVLGSSQKTSNLTSTPSGFGGVGSGGMITLLELRSSFELSDDDDDGLISFDEAMEAMESAFSGTHFHGAEMVRDTLLLTSSSDGTNVNTAANKEKGGVAGVIGTDSDVSSGPPDVTLSELALLSARGLRHDASGPYSALGTVQSSLDDLVNQCFRTWARAALSESLRAFDSTLKEGVATASGTTISAAVTSAERGTTISTMTTAMSDAEWRRLHGLPVLAANADGVNLGGMGMGLGVGGFGDENANDDDALLKKISEGKIDAKSLRDDARKNGAAFSVGQVSPHVLGFLLSAANVLNRSVCPADSLPPVPSAEHAEALGITLGRDTMENTETEITNMTVTVRGALLGEAVSSLPRSLERELLAGKADDDGEDAGDDDLLARCPPSALVQFYVDVLFLRRCLFDRNRHVFLARGGGGGDGNGNGDSFDDEDEDGECGGGEGGGLAYVDESRKKLEGLTHRLETLVDITAEVKDVIAEMHAQAFASCDLFLSSLFGEDDRSGDGAAVFGVAGGGSYSSSALLAIQPLASSRRFVLLPVQAEKSLAELHLRGRYGRKAQEEKASGAAAAAAAAGGTSSGNALGTGFGFLSSMLTKTR